MKSKFKWIEISQYLKLDEIIRNKQEMSIIESNANLITEYEKIEKIILNDFKECNFDKLPSVEEEKITKKLYFFIPSQEKIKERIEKYKEISLLEHIYNVLDEVEKYEFRREIDKYSMKLFALLHDIGKSKCIRDKYNIPHTISHEKASAMYASKILKNTQFEFLSDLLLSAMENNGRVNERSCQYIDLLVYFDKKSREKELKRKLRH